MSLLEVENIAHSYGDNLVFKNGTFSLYKNEHMGIVGLNGAGKSTLLKILTGEIIPDKGQVRWQPRTTLGHLGQYGEIDGSRTLMAYLKTAFQALYDIESILTQRYMELGHAKDETKIYNEISRLQETLERKGFYQIDSEIGRVMVGLGLEAFGPDTPLNQLSGGQRAKAILAKLLLEKPDVLLMDEPNNFLDKDHIDWLSQYLKHYKGAFILISHDEAFLENVTTCICHIEFGGIKKYNGSYQHFLKQLDFQREDHIRQYYAQRKTIEKTEAFIRKNKAGVNSKMARGREKQLNRLERIEAPKFTAQKPRFLFPEKHCDTPVILETKDLEIGYGAPLLPKLHIRLRNREKVALTGFNGIGKSTFLKTVLGLLPPLSGSYELSPMAVPRYYEQDLVWPYPGQTPVQIILEANPRLKRQQILKLLVQNGVGAAHFDQKISSLSGGEQAKVKLCLLSLYPGNFLILDEPTNHLDQNAKDALQEALFDYGGTLLLVSHDPEFYEIFTDRVIAIDAFVHA